MASLLSGFLLAYLMSVSFTDTVEVNVSSVGRLVAYSYNFPSQGLLPNMEYNGSIIASWAVPDSALAGLDGKSIAVRISANAENSTSLSFQSPLGVPVKNYEAYLRCDVSNGACANTSVLSAYIPVIASASPGTSALENLTLKSEITADFQVSDISGPAGSLMDSIKGIFNENSTGQNASQANETRGNFLDSLKPEGDAHDPIAFLNENPIISLAALVVVILITGAYLLNAKD